MAQKPQLIKLAESNHFVFYGLKSSAKKDLQIRKCENAYQRICRALQLPENNQPKIDYYFVETRENVKKLHGTKGTGAANTAKGIVYSIYPYQPHEIVHVLVNRNWLKPTQRTHHVFSEGIAVLQGWQSRGKALWWQKPLKYWVKKFQRENKLIPLKDLFGHFDSHDGKISYPLAAYFVQSLIETYGISKFKKAYQAFAASNFRQAFQRSNSQGKFLLADKKLQQIFGKSYAKKYEVLVP